MTEIRVRVGKERWVTRNHEDFEDALRQFVNAVADPTIQRVELVHRKED